MYDDWKGVVEVILRNGEVVRVYDIRVRSWMTIDPHCLAYRLEAKVSKESDEWIRLGLYFDKTDEKLFSLLQKFREGFNSSYFRSSEENIKRIDMREGK